MKSITEIGDQWLYTSTLLPVSSLSGIDISAGNYVGSAMARSRVASGYQNYTSGKVYLTLTRDPSGNINDYASTWVGMVSGSTVGVSVNGTIVHLN